MIVTATRTYQIHLGFVKPQGITLPSVGSSPNFIEIEDIYADNSSMIGMVESGDALIGGFNKDASEFVGQTELNEHLLGLFVSSAFSNSPGAILGGTSASILSGATEPYDLRYKNYFQFLVDGTLSSPVYQVSIIVEKGIYTASTLSAQLNSIADFSEHLVASVSGGTNVLIEARSKGASSFVVSKVPDRAPLADGNDVTAFPVTAPTTPATGTATQVVFNIVGPTGQGLHKAKVNLAAFTTVYGSGDTPSAGAFVQVARKGKIVSGLYTAGALAVVESDENGDIDVEIADVTHADNPVFLGTLPITGYGFAQVSTARTSISNS